MPARISHVVPSQIFPKLVSKISFGIYSRISLGLPLSLAGIPPIINPAIAAVTCPRISPDIRPDIFSGVPSEFLYRFFQKFFIFIHTGNNIPNL